MSAEPPAVSALPAAPAGDPEILSRVAAELNSARKPVIVTEELGRSLDAVRQLVRLAEALGAPVLDGWHSDYVNFPRDHPLYAVNGATNAVSFNTDLLGAVTITGPGAGRVETAYALLSDIIAIHRGSRGGSSHSSPHAGPPTGRLTSAWQC